MSIDKKHEAEYKTRDLSEAAALVVLGCQLVCLETNGRRAQFVFEDDLASKRSLDFWADRLTVNPRQYALILRSLKDRIYSGR